MGDLVSIAYAVGLYLVFLHVLSAPVSALRLFAATEQSWFAAGSSLI